MKLISSLFVYEDEKTGEQWIQAVFQTNKCGCKITGGGTLVKPLKIDFCEKHKGGE